MKNLQKIFLVLIFIGVGCVSLASCGRYSEPSPVENSGFPHHYPNP